MALPPTTKANQTVLCCLDTSTSSVIQSGIISDNALRNFQWVCYLLCEVISIFGTVSNIINIICFVRQGFRDSVNISLLGLAISDFGSCATLMWTSLCLIPAFQEAGFPFITEEIHYATSGIPHKVFSRITGLITALITLERCLCVTMPLKVKNIFTSKRVTIITIGMYCVLIAIAFPMFYVMRLTWRFERNETVLGLMFLPEKEVIEQYFFTVINFFVPFGSSLIIIICTLILVYKLRQQSAWRATSASQEQQKTSNREVRVTKMIVMISILFFLCFVPLGTAFIAMAFVSGLNVGERYNNMAVIIHSLCFFLACINSSMNIFIYYRMSSKYRATFHKLFPFISTKNLMMEASTTERTQSSSCN